MRRLLLILCLVTPPLSGCVTYNSAEGWHVDAHTTIDNMFAWIPDHRSREAKFSDTWQERQEKDDRDDFDKRCNEEMKSSIPEKL